MSLRTATEKLFGTTTLSERQAAVAKKTYALLSVSVVGAVVGGYSGATSQATAMFFGSPVGWILALVLMNVIPYFALWAAKRNPAVGILALAADGFLSGLAVSPLLYLARVFAPELIPAAAGVTASVFVAVTGYMMVTKDRFSAPTGLLTGIVVSVLAAILINTLLLHSGALGVFLSILIGIFGVLTLVYATSDVLNNPDFDSPVAGALMLFASLFNIFVSTLRVLLSFSSRD
jgi:FtsH-binding integral membrane protein